MSNLVFPQLKTGGIAHYPIRKCATTRTVCNVLPGGTILTYADEAAQKATWSWDYVGITEDEAATLQNFFVACKGPLKPFTFLDPTGNLLSASSDFTASAWQVSSGLRVSARTLCPMPDIVASELVNTSQGVQELGQTLSVPSSFHYCFSAYLSSPAPSLVTLFRRSASSEATASVQIGPSWQRVWLSGSFEEQSIGLSVGIELVPGQQVAIYAAQLQPQPGVSAYVDRPRTGDVYAGAHWALNDLRVRYLGPSDCSVSVSIEA